MFPPSRRLWHLDLGATAHTEYGCDRVRDNGFPRPAVALDGPGWKI